MKEFDIEAVARQFADNLGPITGEIAYNSFIAGARWALFVEEWAAMDPDYKLKINEQNGNKN